MAQKEKRIIEIKVESNAVKEMNEAVKASDGAVKKVGKLGGAMHTARKGINKVNVGFKLMRQAIISTGVGIFVAALGTLAANFKASEENSIRFNKVMNKVQAVTRPIVNLFNQLISTVFDLFSGGSIIDDIKSFGNSLKTFVLDKANQMLEVFKGIGGAIYDVITLDFDGALENAKKAGNAYVDLTVGTVKQGLDALKGAGEDIVKVFKDAKEEADEQLKNADRLNDITATINQFRRETNEFAAEQKKEVERYKLIAEDTTKTLEERNAAGTMAFELENQIAEKRLALVNLEKEQLILKASGRDMTTEELDKLSELNVLQSEIDDDRFSRQTELNNSNNARHKEQLDRLKEQQDAEAEKRAEELMAVESMEDRINKIKEKFRQEDALAEAEKRRQQREDEINELVATEEMKKELIRQSNEAFELEKNDIETQQYNINMQRIEDEKMAKIRAKMQILDTASNIFGKETAIAKALHVMKMGFIIAEMVANIKKASMKAMQDSAEAGISQAQNVQENVKNVSEAGPNPLAIAAAVTFGVAQVAAGIKAMKKTQNLASKLSARSVGTAGGSMARPVTPPSFNVIGKKSAGEQSLEDAINSQNQEPVKAYVVESDLAKSSKTVKTLNGVVKL